MFRPMTDLEKKAVEYYVFPLLVLDHTAQTTNTKRYQSSIAFF